MRSAYCLDAIHEQNLHEHYAQKLMEGEDATKAHLRRISAFDILCNAQKTKQKTSKAFSVSHHKQGLTQLSEHSRS